MTPVVTGSGVYVIWGGEEGTEAESRILPEVPLEDGERQLVRAVQAAPLGGSIAWWTRPVPPAAWPCSSSRAAGHLKPPTRFLPLPLVPRRVAEAQGTCHGPQPERPTVGWGETMKTQEGQDPRPSSATFGTVGVPTCLGRWLQGSPDLLNHRRRASGPWGQTRTGRTVGRRLG